MSTLNLKYLQAFVLTAEKGSFSETARAMGKAQSVISTAIANLEIDLNLTLFIRDGRYPVLTEAGKLLLPEAKAILRRCEQFEIAALSIDEEVESEVTIAIDEHLSMGLFTKHLNVFSDEFPLVQLNFIHPVRHGVIEAVSTGTAQLGIVQESPERSNELQFTQCGTYQLDILVHKDHPLAQEQMLDLETLATYRQVVLNRPSQQHKDPIAIANQTWFTESAFTAANMVHSGCCWGVLPDFIYQNWSKSSDLRRLHTDSAIATWDMGIEAIWHRSRELGPATTWWQQALIRNNH